MAYPNGGEGLGRQNRKALSLIPNLESALIPIDIYGKRIRAAWG